MNATDERTMFCAALGSVSAATAYLLTTAGRVGVVWYLPLERRWAAALPTGALGMDWFSRAFWTLLALCIGATTGWIVPRITTRSLSRWSGALFQIAWLLLGWSAVFTVLMLVRG